VLVEFIQLWNESNFEQRLALLAQIAPHLELWEREEYSNRDAEKLRRGVLIGLTAMFEGELKAEE